MENYFGVVEMIFSFGLVLALCIWQLWALERAKRKIEREKSARERE